MYASLVPYLWASAGFAFCFEPSAPSCVSDYGPFSDQQEFDSCRSDLEDFERDTDSQIQCLQQALEDAISEAQEAARRSIEEATDQAEAESGKAVDAYNTAVEEFNDRAGG